MNLTEIKGKQPELREALIQFCRNDEASILTLSKEMDMPYTTLRSFLIGNSISIKNIFKIMDWLDAMSI